MHNNKWLTYPDSACIKGYPTTGLLKIIIDEQCGGPLQPAITVPQVVTLAFLTVVSASYILQLSPADGVDKDINAFAVTHSQSRASLYPPSP